MKRIVSIVLVALMLFSVATMTAFASELAKEKFDELEKKIYLIAEELNMYVEGSYDPIDAGGFLQYTNETSSNLNSVLNEASAFIVKNRYDVNDNIIEPIEEMDEYMAAIDKAYGELVLVKEDLEFLVEFCQSEKNDDYYSDDVWNNFTLNLENAQAILTDESIVDTRVTDAFWELFESHNKLCLYNDVMGDVDKDGKVSIVDATYIQRYKAELTELNSSQKIVGWIKYNYYGDMDITSATEIQRYLAELSDNTNWGYAYKQLLNSTKPRDIMKNQLFYDAMMDRYWPWL